MRFKKLIQFSAAISTLVMFIGATPMAGNIRRTQQFSTSMKDHIGSVNQTESFWSWHYSGGYWRFNYTNIDNGGNKTITVYDKDIPTYFPGTSKVHTDNIIVEYSLPSSIRNFVNVYGLDKLGIKFNIGQSGSISNDVIYYSFSSDFSKIKISFRPVFLYDTNNWWRGSNAWNSMTTKGKVPVPRVRNGYGTNYLSVFGGGTSIAMTQAARDTAYKDNGSGRMYFNSDSMVTHMSNSGPVPINLRNVWAESTVWGGGNHGVYWDFPVKIDFYDLNVNVGQLNITGNEYYADGTYWVKANDDFTLSTSAYATGSDDIVRVNANYYEINENGNIGYVNSRITPWQTSNTSVNGTNLINIKNGTNIRNGVTLNSTMNASLSGDRDISIATFGRLIHFPNGGADDFGNERIYKNSSMSNRIYIKSDSRPPTAGSNSASYDVNKDTVSLTLNSVSDSRSGVDSNSIKAYVYPSGNPSSKVEVTFNKNGNNYTTNYKFPSSNGVYGEYVVDFVAGDNVGNSGVISTATFNRIAPKPVSDYAVIYDYEYYESSTGIKWVQANNEFRINQKGHGLDRTPSRLYSHLYENGSKKLTTYTDMSRATEVLDSYNGFFKTKDSTAYNVSGEPYSKINNFYMYATSNIHGKIFNLEHQASNIISGKEYFSDQVSTNEKLGIDAKGPEVSVEKTDLDKITVTIKDPDSGINDVVYVTPNGKVEYPSGGKEDKVVITIVDGSKDLIVTDNVGNETVVDVSKFKITRAESSLSLEPVTINGRKKLKVIATAKVLNPMPGNIFTFNLKATGDGVPSSGILGTFFISDATPVTKEYYIDDTFNTSDGPSLSYQSLRESAGVSIGDLADIIKNYSFALEHKADSQNTWTVGSRLDGSFASGFDHFKYKLERLQDSNGNDAYFLVANNEKVTNKYVDMKYLPSGKYKIAVTMYDFNKNPSGTTELLFNHVQPDRFGQLDLNVTAVKDVSWKRAVYPFNYVQNADKFPLGTAYRFNDNPIKLGYTLNFNIGLVSGVNPLNYEIKYDVYGKDSSGNRVNLLLTLDGKDLTYHDANNGTNYLSQTSGFTTNNGRLYVKHYLPASLNVKRADGSPYSGVVYVDAKFKGALSDTGIDSLNGTYHLYSVVLDSTAFDDLGIDKQR